MEKLSWFNSANANCMFCRIAHGEEESYITFEDGISLAFLDRRPLFWGHSLLIPKNHYETLADLPPALVGPFFVNVQLLSLAIERVLEAEGTLVAINNRISQSIPHLHVHIVPRRRKDGLKGFFWPRIKYRDEAHMAQVRDALRSAIIELRAR